MKKIKKASDAGLPHVVYVYQEIDGGESYLLVNEHVQDIDDDRLVGIYKLTETKVKRTSHVLVDASGA